MNNHERDELVGDLFLGDWHHGPAAAFAQEAASQARRRRRRRRLLLALSTCVGLVLALLGLRPTPTPAPAREHATASASTPSYEVISDDELLARVRDVPLLVMAKDDGSRAIVVLTN